MIGQRGLAVGDGAVSRCSDGTAESDGQAKSGEGFSAVLRSRPRKCMRSWTRSPRCGLWLVEPRVPNDQRRVREEVEPVDDGRCGAHGDEGKMASWQVDERAPRVDPRHHGVSMPCGGINGSSKALDLYGTISKFGDFNLRFRSLGT
ncbi:hypothetical protein SETIT_8G119300v2 [Setaria italica]|uniref:Uncharacterized protein n=1 Tax=Setaria italica TaxID=4555 RepID=A0A368S6Z3_SETIT|nr:hypothetical protein SETIT_8G119300v2 [Setaria italica]